MTEETFGPIMPVMPFDSVDEAIALANDSEFGLSACVLAGTHRGGARGRTAHRRRRHQHQRRLHDVHDLRGREEFLQILGARRFAHGFAGAAPFLSAQEALIVQHGRASRRTASVKPHSLFPDQTMLEGVATRFLDAI
jgi:hypothetical protein